MVTWDAFSSRSSTLHHDDDITPIAPIAHLLSNVEIGTNREYAFERQFIPHTCSG